MTTQTCGFEKHTDELLAGHLTGSAAQSANEHLSGCEVCAGKAVRNGGQATAGGVVPHGLAVEMPARIGPFVVLEKLGEGGMGSVFTAYHPELDRKVAIKILRPLLDDSETKSRAHARLLREAQSMAKLDNPHVVAIHDVGTFEQGIYLVMDRVEGVTLSQWLKAEPRTWQQVIGVMTQAARGLEAAHQAGLIHRDFKPANVLVGTNGRVRVADFGIARFLASQPDNEGGTELTQDSGQTTAEAHLTAAGSLVGTPAYMGPEQFAGKTADALTDQFSFCATLYEAMYGARPFEARAIAGDRFSLRVPPPSILNEPAFIRAAVLRGLSIEPSQRFESMGSLIDELERKPLTLKGAAPWAIACGVTLLSAVGAYAATRPEPIGGCDVSNIALTGIWGSAEKLALTLAFNETRDAKAAHIATSVSETFDTYAADWSRAQGLACEAARAAPKDSPAEGQLKCLDFQKTQLLALIDVLTHLTPDMVVEANVAAASLTPVSRCNDARAISTLPRTPSDPLLRLKVQRLRLQIANATALSLTGQLGRARIQLLDLVAQSGELKYLPLEAEAKWALANIYSKLNDTKAEASFRASARAAELTGQDALAAEALAGGAFYKTYSGHREAAQEMVEHAELLLERSGGDPLLESNIENSKSLNAAFDGQLESSMQHMRRSVDLKQRVLGPKHPSTLLYLCNVAQSEADLCDSAAAAKTLNVFDSPREAARIPSVYGRGLTRLVEARATVGDFSGALKALELAESLVAPDDFNAQGELAIAATTLSVRSSDGESALRWAERSVAAATHLGPGSIMAVAAQETLGSAQGEAGLSAQAVATLERALPLHKKQFGEDQVKPVYLSLARAYVLAGRPADALTALSATKAVFEKACATAEERAEVDWLKARALKALRRDPGEARTLARAARAVFASLPWRHREVAAIDGFE